MKCKDILRTKQPIICFLTSEEQESTRHKYFYYLVATCICKVWYHLYIFRIQMGKTSSKSYENIWSLLDFEKTGENDMFSFITFEPYTRKSKWIPFLETTVIGPGCNPKGPLISPPSVRSSRDFLENFRTEIFKIFHGQ